MKSKIGFFLAAYVSLFAYAIYFWVEYARKLQSLSFNEFTTTFQRYALLGSLLVFALALWEHKRAGTPHPISADAGSKTWTAVVICLLSATLALSIYVNPHARISAHRFPFVTPSARSIKLDLYQKLNSSPDLAVFGSSRAFTISPAYIQKKLGYKTFNLSVESGKMEDAQTFLNLLLASPSAPHPSVILLELSASDLIRTISVDDGLLPISLVPYMSYSMKARTITSTMRDFWGMQSLSDSVYILANSVLGPSAPRTWSFEQDGVGVRAPTDTKTYNEEMKRVSNYVTIELSCARINKQSAAFLEEIVATAENAHIGMVIYSSPVNNWLYDEAMKRDAEGVSHCKKVLRSYMSSLAASHPNVFFKNLSYYPPVSNMKERGFYDGIHLKPRASELVVDALSSELIAAYQWSQER
ncbi:MAG: hypothetical protein PHQ36_09360 [Anaerolineales bacterium]|nr:hypothetical protein [Anaerolineales bacterium]